MARSYTLCSSYGRIFLDRVPLAIISPDFFVVHMDQISGLICCAQDGHIVLKQKLGEAQLLISFAEWKRCEGRSGSGSSR